MKVNLMEILSRGERRENDMTRRVLKRKRTGKKLPENTNFEEIEISNSRNNDKLKVSQRFQFVMKMKII